MAKKGIYYDDVLRMFVTEGHSIASIAKLLPVSEKAIRIWKEEDKASGNDWDLRRKQYLASRQSFHEEAYEFGRELMNNVRAAIRDGKEPSQSQLYLLKEILGKVTKIKDYEEAVVKSDKEHKGGEGLTPEKVMEIREKLLGLK